MHWTGRIAEGARSTAGIWSVPAALGAFMVALWGGGAHVFDALVLRADAVASGQWWRLVTGHFVHWSAWHVAVNAGGLAIWLLLCPVRWSLPRWSGVLVVEALAVSGGVLWMSPDVMRYAGFSGILHGLFLVALVPQAFAGDRIAGACLLYLVGKVGLEQIVGPVMSDAEHIGAAIATESHLAGLLGGLALLLAPRGWRAVAPRVSRRSRGD